MNNNRNAFIMLAIVIIATTVVYQIVVPRWVTYDAFLTAIAIVTIYCVFVIPQQITLKNLLIVDYLQDDDVNAQPPKQSLWSYVIGVNDFILCSYYGRETFPKAIVTGLHKTSLILFILSALYMNGLVVFMDLGVTLTITIGYVLTISLVVYIITKAIMIGYFINIFKGPIASIVAILHPIGFMFLNWAIPHHVAYLEELQEVESMGEDYE